MSKKSRFWQFIVYPESAPFNWKEILEQFHLPIAVSPCHDQDDDGKGGKKKPHYHVICAFGNTTTSTHAQEISDACSGVLVVPVMSLRGAYDYLTHLNAPAKHQYDKTEIVLISGFAIEDYVSLSDSQKAEFRNIVFEKILKDKICDCVTLLETFRKDDFEIYDYIFRNLTIFSKIVDSMRYLKYNMKYIEREYEK